MLLKDINTKHKPIAILQLESTDVDCVIVERGNPIPSNLKECEVMECIEEDNMVEVWIR